MNHEEVKRLRSDYENLIRDVRKLQFEVVRNYSHITDLMRYRRESNDRIDNLDAELSNVHAWIVRERTK